MRFFESFQARFQSAKVARGSRKCDFQLARIKELLSAVSDNNTCTQRQFIPLRRHCIRGLMASSNTSSVNGFCGRKYHFSRRSKELKCCEWVRWLVGDIIERIGTWKFVKIARENASRRFRVGVRAVDVGIAPWRNSRGLSGLNFIIATRYGWQSVKTCAVNCLVNF